VISPLEQVPWLDEDEDDEADIVTDTGMPAHQSGAYDDELAWFGFNIQQNKPDDGGKEADVMSVAPIDISGTYTVYISGVSTWH